MDYVEHGVEKYLEQEKLKELLNKLGCMLDCRVASYTSLPALSKGEGALAPFVTIDMSAFFPLSFGEGLGVRFYEKNDNLNCPNKLAQKNNCELHEFQMII